MGIFGNIMDAIFGSSAEAATPESSGADASDTAAAPGGEVDVAAILDGLAAANKEKLNWKTSIVDLMKLLDLDSSLSDRKSLAEELNYSGDMNDSASMNIWLQDSS